MADTEVRDALRNTTLHLIFLVFVSTLGPLQFGYHIAELNAPQNAITCPKKAPRLVEWLQGSSKSEAAYVPDCIPMSEATFATISSVFTVGGLIGALCSGPFSSKRGRLLAMRITALLFLFGSLVETFAGNAPAMALGRFFSGIGAGGSTVIVPLYISEIAPPDARGFFGVMTQVSINVGILATQVLGLFLSYGGVWRWILGAGALIGVSQVVGLLAVPESPAWTAAHGDVTRAKRTLQRIRGKDADIQDEVAAWGDDTNGEEQGLLSEPSNSTRVAPVHLGFAEVVRDPLYRPAIIAVVGVMAVQQFCGINSIIMYSVSLLADLLPISSAFLTVIISIVNLAMTLACSPLPDRLGRKTCLLISVIGQGSSSFALALSIVLGYKVLSAISVLFFVAFFAVGLGPVPFILSSELVGQEAVGAAQSWCLAAAYVSTFFVAQFFPILNTALNNALGGHGWVYFIFAAVAAVSTLFIQWKIPETKGKRDLDEVWGRVRRLD